MLKVNVKPHAYFKREGQDIQTDCVVSISQAVLGASVKIKTLYGDVNVKVQAGT
jgi:molecular chaperone DnaJ